MLHYIMSYFPKTRNIDGAIDHRLDPDSEQRPRTLACARPKKDPPKGTFKLAAESDYTLPNQAQKKEAENIHTARTKAGYV